METGKPIEILITAGGTSENIDDVRRITNSGTGQLGALVADEFFASELPCHITYLCSSPAVRPVLCENIDVIIANSVLELYSTVKNLLENRTFDIIVHSMAIGDYYVKAVSDSQRVSGEIIKRLSYMACGDSSAPEEAIEDAILSPPPIVESKISSDKENLIVVLEKAPKIISMFRGFAPNAVIVGFKLLSNVEESELLSVGLALLKKNDCDYVLANDMRTVQAGSHEGLLISEGGSFERAYGKDAIAELISTRTIEKLLAHKNGKQ